MIIKAITSAPPTSMEISPMRTESAPRVGPTVRSSMILTGAGREPALKGDGQVLGLIQGKTGPVILALPPAIRSWILGAE